MRMVLQTLREHQLYAILKKGEFWLEEVVFLGHVDTNKQIKLTPEGEGNHEMVKATNVRLEAS